MVPISLIAFFTLGLIFFAIRQKKVRKIARSLREPDPEWTDVASVFFGGEETSDSAKLELALRTAARKLGLSHALVTVQGPNGCVVLRLVSEGYARPRLIEAGRHVARKMIYCGELGEGRNSLAIDFASLSDWRYHSAHRELGWESYLGARATLTSGESLTVGFFDTCPRERLFSSSEKQFATQMAGWIAAMVQRMPVFAATTTGFPIANQGVEDTRAAQ